MNWLKLFRGGAASPPAVAPVLYDVEISYPNGSLAGAIRGVTLEYAQKKQRDFNAIPNRNAVIIPR